MKWYTEFDNNSSIRLAERAGFTFEGVRKEFALENDKWVSFSVYYKNRG